MSKLLIIGIMLVIMFPGTSFGQEPDYNKPYAPISTDKETYSWTDKVTITINAPSWNTGDHIVDSIGGIETHAIKISSKENSLEPYKLTETSANSGTFRGEVILTGFLHDVNGDGTMDTNPRTFGNGPTGGFLETSGQDDAITISFEFADGVVLTRSVQVRWIQGEVFFDKDRYGLQDTANFKVIDADMNLNPERIDSLQVEISSDSDMAGVVVEATETSKDSGIFKGNISFTNSRTSSGNVLYAVPEDSIVAKYVDRTLPRPHSTSDSLDITDNAEFVSGVPKINSILLDQLHIASPEGKILENVVQGEMAQMVASLTNNQEFTQSYSAIIQVKDKNQTIRFISWVSGQLNPVQNMEVSQSWNPEKAGNYTVQVFVWESLGDATPLSPVLEESFQVKKAQK